MVAQRPAGGSRAEPNAAVDLFLALGNRSETYLMPDLISRNYDSFRSYFERRGFRFGKVSYEKYGRLAPGTVLRQYPLAGHPLHRGDVIALKVVAPEEVPADELDEAEASELASDPSAAERASAGAP